MQRTSAAFKESIRNTKKIRNRGYIRAYIGIINQEAQKNIQADNTKNNLAPFSNLKEPFDGGMNRRIYATGEQDFSSINGNMFFLPRDMKDATYNNGIVTNDLLGTVYIKFKNKKSYDIKGLTIDFGENYPVDFTINSDDGIHSYVGNNNSIWTTEDTFTNTTFFEIKVTKMLNGMNRLRILEFSCGIVKSFSNQDTIKCTIREFTSPISETIPSSDIEVSVNNTDLYYDPDNPQSAIAFMEPGQRLSVSFGYDVTGYGDIEWLDPVVGNLVSWDVNENMMKFYSKDRFAMMSEIYYKGTYNEEGISLYDMSIDVLSDAGITNKSDYELDDYLKKVIVHNPLPPVRHSEALQIIANAGRCTLSYGRNGKISILSNFVPRMNASSINSVEFSDTNSILKGTSKEAYAMASKDFTKVDGSVHFYTHDKNYLKTGYVSNAVSNENGVFIENPKITIDLEAVFSCYGFGIGFRNVIAEEFEIVTYNRGTQVMRKKIINSDIDYFLDEKLESFDKIELIFTKAKPNSRIAVDSVFFGDYTDYHLTKDCFKSNPERIRRSKISEIQVEKSILVKKTEIKELVYEYLHLENGENNFIFMLQNPSYGYQVSVENGENITAQIVEQGTYYAKVKLINSQNTTIETKVTLTGYEYEINKSLSGNTINRQGEVIKWKNPLVSEQKHALEIKEWLAKYLTGMVDYNIQWWGDPSSDANDAYWIETNSGEDALIRSYENVLEFNGSWSGSMKARRLKSDERQR